MHRINLIQTCGAPGILHLSFHPDGTPLPGLHLLEGMASGVSFLENDFVLLSYQGYACNDISELCRKHLWRRATPPSLLCGCGCWPALALQEPVTRRVDVGRDFSSSIRTQTMTGGVWGWEGGLTVWSAVHCAPKKSICVMNHSVPDC